MLFKTRRLGQEDALHGEAVAMLERLVPRAWERMRELGVPVEGVIAAVMPHPTGETRIIGASMVVRLDGEDGMRGGSGLVVGPVVDEQLRRMGVGRRLLTEIEREGFGSRRFAELHARVPEASVAFLESLGWARVECEGIPEGLCDLVLRVEGETGSSDVGGE
ncbi:MAG: GNAT family N-acetyltransferase [Phycisphaerales bacterium JB043]